MLYILVGESASGKSTLAKEMHRKNFGDVLVTCTTRPMREGEIDGVDYHFMSDDEFLASKREGKFLETAAYNVASGTVWYYGSRLADISENCIAVLTPAGCRAAKAAFGKSAVAIYLRVPRKDRMIKAITRGDNIDEAYRRNVSDEGMFAGMENEVDFILDNPGYEKSVDELILALIHEYGLMPACVCRKD